MVMERAKLLASLFSWERDLSVDGFRALIELKDEGSIIEQLPQYEIDQSYFLKSLFEYLKPKQILDLILLFLDRSLKDLVSLAVQEISFYEVQDLIVESLVKELGQKFWSSKMYDEVLLIDGRTKILFLSEDQYKTLLSMPKFQQGEQYEFDDYYISRNVLIKYINNYTPPFNDIKDWLEQSFTLSASFGIKRFDGFPLNSYPDNRSEIIDTIRKNIIYA